MSDGFDAGAVSAGWLSWPSGIARIGVLLCVAVTVAGALWFGVIAASDARDESRSAAALSFADREVGGGNSVVADQDAVFHARALIPRDATFEVVVGEPVDGWSELTEHYATLWYRSDLIPRRLEPGAPWVICYGCNRSSLGSADVLWEGESGIAILRRRG